MTITFAEFDLIHTALARHVVDTAGEDGHDDLRVLLQKWATWRSDITEVVQCADCRTWLQRPTCEPASDYCARCGQRPQQMDLFVGSAGIEKARAQLAAIRSTTATLTSEIAETNAALSESIGRLEKI